MVEETLPVMLEAMWAANVMDIKQTLAKVCTKVLEEEGVPKADLKLRAMGLKEVGVIFQATTPPATPEGEAGTADAGGKGTATASGGGNASAPEKAKKTMQDAMMKVCGDC